MNVHIPQYAGLLHMNLSMITGPRIGTSYLCRCSIGHDSMGFKERSGLTVIRSLRSDIHLCPYSLASPYALVHHLRSLSLHWPASCTPLLHTDWIRCCEPRGQHPCGSAAEKPQGPKRCTKYKAVPDGMALLQSCKASQPSAASLNVRCSS